MLISKSCLAVVAVLAVLATLSLPSEAATAGPDGYYRTGEAVQTANHWPFTMDVFAIWHDMKQLPPARSRQAVIDLDGDKRFSLRMMRDVDADKLKWGLRDGFARNGYSDTARIDTFLSVLTGTLPKNEALWITYDAGSKTTHFIVAGGGAVSVDSIDFMRATWSIWFGRSKPAKIGDELMSQL